MIGVVALSAYLRHAMRASLPQLDGRLSVAGLSAPVPVTRDAHGVPSIQAQNLDDLLFAQGFITAQDRLWQMDALRRHAAGELAEVLGPGLAEHDKLQRYLQIRSAADRAIAVLPPDQLHQLEAYARGVNAEIEHSGADLPVEFKLLHYKPAPWSPRDSLLVALVMSQDLATEFPRKLDRERLSAHLPPDLLADLYPVGSWRDRPPTQTAPDLTAPQEKIKVAPLDNTQSYLQPVGLQQASCDECRAGSNNWVVAASRSASGAPLLSNDMHLSLTVPDIWYEAQLHADTLDVAGFTLPGVPFVIVGRNAHVAWGFTNLGGDVQDIYIEHLRGTGPNTEYERSDGNWYLAGHQQELIHVRGSKDLTLDVLTTKHALGTTWLTTPVISPLYPADRRTLALAWNIYDPTIVRSPFFDINRAADAASLVAAFAGFGSVAQNMVYADEHHIGYHTVGRIPIRGPAIQRPRPHDEADVPVDDDDSSEEETPEPPTHHGKPEAPIPPKPPVIDYTIGSPISSVPVDALDASQAWSGYVPYDALPSVLDPTSGVIATANARITPDDYPYHLANDWADPFRVERIVTRLEGRTGLTTADMLALQTDVHSELDRLVAQRLAYAIDHATLDSRPDLRKNAKRLHLAADLLRDWNGDLTQDSPAAAIVTAARAELWPMLLTPQIAAHDRISLNDAAKVAALYTWPERTSALELLLDHEPARWLLDGFATWSDLLATAVVQGLNHSHAPSNLTTWNYGSTHTVEIAHPVFGSHSFVSWLLGVSTGTGPRSIGGDGTTVRAVGAHFGASERFTADLSEPSLTNANITTGESANPLSPYYLDQFTSWLSGTTLGLPLHPRASSHTLSLQPQ
jgi:penicillin amidase